MRSLFAVTAVSLLIASPALADCAGSHSLDRCLVGTWSYASGGSAAWMSRNIHMAHITGLSHNSLNVTLRPDGTFSTGNVDVHSSVAANNGEVTGTAHATGQTSGQWSAAGGHLNFCATASTFQQTVTVVVHGRPITVTPHAMPVRPTAMDYVCNATTLKTTQPMAHLEPIVTLYNRGH